MTDMIDLALKYGGFTSLDKIYLKNSLKDMTPDQQLSFITPPPSVINAYFAEIYQKQGPEAATDYYLDLVTSLKLFNNKPSFDEVKPFIRLNLSGKSYGFTYESVDAVALVFSEKAETISQDIIFELAQVFPHYKIYVQNRQIKMAKVAIDEEILEDLTPETALLSTVSKLKSGVMKLTSFNQDELADLLETMSGTIYYTYNQRQFVAYVVEK